MKVGNGANTGSPNKLIPATTNPCHDLRVFHSTTRLADGQGVVGATCWKMVMGRKTFAVRAPLFSIVLPDAEGSRKPSVGLYPLPFKKGCGLERLFKTL